MSDYKLTEKQYRLICHLYRDAYDISWEEAEERLQEEMPHNYVETQRLIRNLNEQVDKTFKKNGWL